MSKRPITPAALAKDAQKRELAATITGSTGGCSGKDDPAGRVIARALTAHPSRIDGESETFITHALTGEGFDASEDGSGRGTPLVPVAYTLHGADKTVSTATETKIAGSVRTKPPGSIENSSTTVVLEPYTLAIRGRSDAHNLEYRQDGIANAVLTPNGGRGGIGVGAIAFDTTQITSKTNRSQPRPGEPCHPVTAEGHAPAIAYNITPSQSNKDYKARPTQRAQAVTSAGNRPSARGGDVIAFDTTQITSAENRSQPKAGDPCHPISATGHAPALAFDARQSDVLQYGDMSGPLDTDGHTIGIQSAYAVRRLTPRECERLQGAPDDWTLVTYRGKPMADGPRYKMIGNSWAVPCVRWIGNRIAHVDMCLKAERDEVVSNQGEQ